MQIPIDPLRHSTPGMDAGPVVGLLVCRDLIFTTKITGTAQALGYRFSVAGSLPLALKAIEQDRPKVILVDLAAGELGKPEAIQAYQRGAGPETPIVAFGSHVDADSLAAARLAGCRDVMPRSKFSAELPSLIQSYCAEPETP